MRISTEKLESLLTRAHMKGQNDLGYEANWDYAEEYARKVINSIRKHKKLTIPNRPDVPCSEPTKLG